LEFSNAFPRKQNQINRGIHQLGIIRRVLMKMMMSRMALKMTLVILVILKQVILTIYIEEEPTLTHSNSMKQKATALQTPKSN